ncbi:hypothetical protein QMA15_27350 [Rhodococcus sp. APC 3903]|nr:hypothetical protein [Rhodococcus sp. APC 3903]MDN3460152.1 hypothetical protein [Rhodococcus sp. APC 3903]
MTTTELDYAVGFVVQTSHGCFDLADSLCCINSLCCIKRGDADIVRIRHSQFRPRFDAEPDTGRDAVALISIGSIRVRVAPQYDGAAQCDDR